MRHKNDQLFDIIFHNLQALPTHSKDYQGLGYLETSLALIYNARDKHKVYKMIHKIISLFLVHNVQLLQYFPHLFDTPLNPYICYILFRWEIAFDIDLVAHL